MGWWGRSHAARPHPGLVSDAPPPPIAVCARCETSVVMAGGKLPKGWVETDGEAFCPDDAPRSAPGPRQRLRCVEPRVRHVTIGTPGTTYGGCRISHEFAAGFVGLRIHAGYRAPRDRRDDPINFMLDRKGLDELIRHLCDIRKGLPNG
jgi:hypothetical protein